jgi:hypothetical protein
VPVSIDQAQIGELSLAETVDEVETRCEECKQHPFLCVASGQCVGHRVCCTRLVFDGEVEAQELAHPLVLRNCGQALVQ